MLISPQHRCLIFETVDCQYMRWDEDLNDSEGIGLTLWYLMEFSYPNVDEG